MSALDKLLLDEQPLQLIPSLAIVLNSVSEAVLLQQLHWMLRRHTALEEDGNRYVKVSIEQWQDTFPFWSDRTIRRLLQSLSGKDIVTVTRGRESNVYGIDRVKLAELVDKMSSPERPECPPESGQNDRSPCKRENSEENNEEKQMTDTAVAAPATVTSDQPQEATLPGLEPPKPPPGPDVPDSDSKVEEVWTFYFAIFGDKLGVKALTDPRRKRIRAGLRAANGDVDFCKRVILGLKEYRRAHPQGSKDTTLDTAFGSRPGGQSITEQMEFWASAVEDQGPTLPSRIPELLQSRVTELALEILTAEREPDDEARQHRRKRAEHELADRFKLKAITNGKSKLLRWEEIA